MATGPENIDLEFRDWEPADLAQAVRVSQDAWPDDTEEVPASFDHLFIRSYERSATHKRVATVNGDAVGLLFGRVNRDMRPAGWLNARLAQLLIYASAALIIKGSVKHRWTFMRTLMKADSKAVHLQPSADGEITLLFLSPEYHGRGIGKKLVGDFLDEARRKGAARINVVTAEDSNWQFYEHLGFERIGEFFDDFDSYVLKKRIMGFVYTIELVKEEI